MNKTTNWKKGTQKLVVLVEVDKKVHQVDLSEEQMNNLLFILPQLFDDRVIKVLEYELPITIPSHKKIKQHK